MSDSFHANQVTIAFANSSQEPDDPGETLLIFECVCPTREGDQETMGRVVVGMTYANALSFSRLFREQLEAPHPVYRGPIIRKQ